MDTRSTSSDALLLLLMVEELTWRAVLAWWSWRWYKQVKSGSSGVGLRRLSAKGRRANSSPLAAKRDTHTRRQGGIPLLGTLPSSFGPRNQTQRDR